VYNKFVMGFQRGLQEPS